MKRDQGASEFLRMVASALSQAEAHRDGRSIVAVSPIRLRRMGEKLAEIAETKAPGRQLKSALHRQWGLAYWTNRAIAPEDMERAIHAVQALANFLDPGAPTPKVPTIQRAVRKYRQDALLALERDEGVAFTQPLRDHLKKRERAGQW